MFRLRTVLQRTVEQRAKFGGAVSVEVRSALRAHRRLMSIAFAVLFAVLVCAVALGTFALAWFIREPKQVAVFAGAMGMSVGGGIELMRRVWKEWSQASLLLILVEDASEAQIAALIDKAIKGL